MSKKLVKSKKLIGRGSRHSRRTKTTESIPTMGSPKTVNLHITKNADGTFNVGGIDAYLYESDIIPQSWKMKGDFAPAISGRNVSKHELDTTMRELRNAGYEVTHEKIELYKKQPSPKHRPTQTKVTDEIIRQGRLRNAEIKDNKIYFGMSFSYNNKYPIVIDHDKKQVRVVYRGEDEYVVSDTLSAPLKNP